MFTASLRKDVSSSPQSVYIDEDARSGEEFETMTIGDLFKLAAHLLPQEASLCCRLLSIMRTGTSEAITKRPLGHLNSEARDVLDRAIVVTAKFCAPNSARDRDDDEGMPTKTSAPSESVVMDETARGLSHHHQIDFAGYKVRLPPLLPPTSIGCRRRRLFMIFNEPHSCLPARIVEFIIMLSILVSTVSFVLESMPAFRHRPLECELLKASGLPLTVDACEPDSDPIFWYVELICIFIFTLEYLVRVSMYHSLLSGGGVSLLVGTLRFMSQPLNVIDILAILPFYLGLIVRKGSTGPMRILRLCRVLRLFKAVKHLQGMIMLKEVMVRSNQPLMILVFFNSIIMIIFGSLLYFIEGQRYSVDPIFTLPRLDPVTNMTIEAPFPTGVYVRSKPLMDNTDEPSPVRTIPRACWWVLVTMATVGYGDIYPTTWLGKCVAIVCYYVGIIFLALPINIIGSNFNIVYNERRREKGVHKSPSNLHKFRSMTTTLSDTWMPQVDSWRKRIFLLLEDPSASRLGNLISSLLTIIIIISTISFVLDSMEFAKSTPDVEKCKRELTIHACEPVSTPEVDLLETVCVSLFTLDYIFRIGLAHSAEPSDCGLSGQVTHGRPLKTTIVYCLHWLNIIDFLAILPYYVSLLGASSGGASVLRVLRLVRVFRVLKMPRVRACADMFIDIIRDSVAGLMLLFVMTLLVCVLYSSLVHFAESSTYSVTDLVDLCPLGCYVRPTIDGFGVEVSPFQSIFHTFWWFFTTATTVGYGDIVPTTTFGRIVGVLTLYTGIVLVGLKITVVGSAFNKHFPEWAAGLGVQTGSALHDQEGTALKGECSSHESTKIPIPERVRDEDEFDFNSERSMEI